MAYERDLLLFTPKNNELFITEFGHSRASVPKEALPQVRNSYILHIPLKGKTNFYDTIISPGEAFLLSRKVLHSFSFDAEFEDIWLAFNGENAESILNALSIPTQSHVIFKIDNFAEIRDFLSTNLPLLKETKSETLALSMLMYCLPHLSMYRKQTHLKNYVEMAKKFIDNNYQHHISICQVAENVNLSEKYLCKLFKKALFVSPQQYLIETRMKMARKLLENTDISIKAVAENVGFPSQFAFSTAFKKYYKIPPSVYRNKST